MNQYMEAAMKEAYDGIEKGDGGPFGCVIVKNHQIVGRGHNEVVGRKDPTCHGEMMAIHDACQRLRTFDLSGCELYTTGEPCPMCYGAILWANISKVFYGCNIQDAEEIGFRDLVFYQNAEEEKKELFTELDRKECQELYQKYQQIQNKIRY